MLKLTDTFATFSSFAQFPELACLISTRSIGDMNVRKHPIEQALPLVSTVPAIPNQLVLMQQVHGGDIAEVTRDQMGTIVQGVDGLFTSSPELFLGVNTADCVPMFFYDPQKKRVAVAHAGWRGTLASIATRMIIEFTRLGSDPAQIRVGIGPHIGACCYNVPQERARQFTAVFPNMKHIVIESGENWYLDLGAVNRLQLIEAGVLAEQVDAPIACTSCQNDRYFSFRKEQSETFGEILGVIGIKV